MIWNYRVGFRKECYSIVDNNDHSKVVDILEAKVSVVWKMC